MTEEKNWWKKGVDAFVESAGYAFIRTSPLTGPLPSVYVLLNTSNGWKSLLIVLGVELIGYAVGDTAVKALKRKVLPEKIILWAIGAYLATIEGLMLGYNVIPAWTSWHDGTVTTADAIRASVSILYPFFTLAGAGLYAFYEFMAEGDAKVKREEQAKLDEVKASAQLQLEDRKLEIEERRRRKQVEWEAEQTRKAQLFELELEAKKASLHSSLHDTLHDTTIVTGNVTGNVTPVTTDETPLQRRKRVAGYYRLNTGASYQQAANDLGLPNKILVSRDLEWLKKQQVLDVVTQGRNVIVTVNGKFDEFMASE